MENVLQSPENEPLMLNRDALRPLFVSFVFAHFGKGGQKLKINPFFEIFSYFIVNNKIISAIKISRCKPPRHIESLTIRQKALGHGAVAGLVAEPFKLGKSPIWAIWKKHQAQKLKEEKVE